MATLDQHGVDDHSIWRWKNISMGNQILNLKPQPHQAHNILSDTPDQLKITADACLHNRCELFDSLSIPHHQTAFWSNEKLILAAYRKWGDNCPEYLSGDFCFAIWDDNKQRLFCCRDHMGRRPLYYYYDTQRFIFASEIKAILAASGIPRQLNKKHLAALANPALAKQDKQTTLFTGINSIAPASTLSVSEKGIQTCSYWQPDITARLAYQSDEDILSAFQELMFKVVGARLQSDYPVAALLSGGLDSSAIVSVAAQHLAKQGKSLMTMSAINTDDNRQNKADEREYIDLFKQYPNIELNYIKAPDKGPFDQLERIIHDSETPLITSRHYLYSAFAELAQYKGARIICDGAFGEIGPSFHAPTYLQELFVSGHWNNLAHEVNCRSQQTSQSVWQIWRSQILAPILKPYIKPVKNNRHWLFQTKFLKQYQVQGFLNPARYNKKLFQHHSQYRSIVSAQKSSRVVGFNGYQKVCMSYPFLDKRLLEFCLAAPETLKVRNGYSRYLIRAGLDGVLPTKIQWRTSKQPFSPDYHLRYNRQKKHARQLLETIQPKDPVREVINIDNLKSLVTYEMNNNRANSSANRAGLHQVPTGIYFITFLRQFSEFKS